MIVRSPESVRATIGTFQDSTSSGGNARSSSGAGLFLLAAISLALALTIRAQESGVQTTEESETTSYLNPGFIPLKLR